MNPLRSLCLVACLLATSFATARNNMDYQSSMRSNSLTNSLKPTEWLTVSELESVPSVDQVSLRQLESLTTNEGAQLLNQLYHLSQIHYDLTPNFVPSANEVPAYVVMPNGQNVSVPLSQLVSTVKQQPNFGDDEVTIVVTGLPAQTSHSVAKANQKLVRAYQRRYNNAQQEHEHGKNHHRGEKQSSEEDSAESTNTGNSNTGNLIVIDMGATFNTFERLAMVDVERTGVMLGKVIVQLSNVVPQEIMHMVAQGVSSHIVGIAGRFFSASTGHKLRRITALDPSRVYAKNPNTLTDLSRGDAEFVDAIHTSAYGMGVPTRVGDVDFYPNGPSAGVPGADNVVEASMRATCYFAESVVPGNERNFPAVAASSLEEYKNNEGYGQRTYMGIATDYDLEGIYMLQVNPHAPFGKRTPAQKQSSYHAQHEPSTNTRSRQNSRSSSSQDYQ